MKLLNRLFPVILCLTITANPIFIHAQEEYIDGESIQSILEKGLPANPGRVIKVHPQTGTIIVRDTPTNHKEIARLLREIDIGPQQITIESRFVELNDTNLSEIGINWGSTFLWYDYNRAPLDQRQITKMITGGTSPGSQGNLVTFSNTASTNEGFNMQMARLRDLQFDLLLRALASNDKANLLSSPRITTINGQPANIQIVRSVPYVSEVELTNEGTSSAPIWNYDYTISEEEVGITLVVTPRVGEDSKIITLELEPEVEVLACRLIFLSGVEENLGWPVIDRRSAKTTAMVQSGETVVIGGLLDDSDVATEQKVPFLGDIPLLGNLFRHNYTRRAKKNLLIFVTASLINPEGEEITDIVE